MYLRTIFSSCKSFSSCNPVKKSLLLLFALGLAGSRPGLASAPVELAVGRYAVVRGDPSLRGAASRVADLVDRAVPRAAAIAGAADRRSIACLVVRRDRSPASGSGSALPPGEALYPWGVIVIDVSQIDIERLGALVAHEVGHIMVARALGDAYPGLPIWFNEGVAQYIEGRSRAEADTEAAAGENGELQTPLSELDALFARALAGDLSQERVQYAYAKALSVVSYLVSRDGEDVIARLLAATRARGQFALALHQVTGLEGRQLEAAWHAALQGTPTWVTSVDVNLLVWALMVVLLAAAVVRYYLTRRRRDAEEGEDEVEASE